MGDLRREESKLVAGLSVAPVMAASTVSNVRGWPFAMRDVHGIVTRAVSAARATGRDYVAQSHAAAAAVIAVRPDLSMGDALDAVMRLRDFGDAA